MIIVQAGHVNCNNNCDPSRHGETGAPGEIDWTPVISSRVVQILNAQGISARMVDANFNCASDRLNVYDGVVAVHYNSDSSHESGYYVGPGNPDTDGAAEQSAALANSIRSHYADSTHLAWRPGWDSINIREYYIFNSIAAATPFCLIECGTGAPGAPDHDFLWSSAGMDAVVYGIAGGILAYMGKPFQDRPPEPTPVPIPTVEDSSMRRVLCPEAGVQYLLSGSLYVHIPNNDDAIAIDQSGIPSMTVSKEFHESLLAAAQT